MPDFDKNLQPIIKDTSVSSLNPGVGEARDFAGPDPGRTIWDAPKIDISEKDPYSELKKLSESSSFREKGVFVTDAVLNANKRYETYNPTIENQEDFASYGQSNWTKAANGLMKGVNLTATTVIGGFGMVVGAGAAIMPGGKFSDIWDNPIMQGLDEWNNKVDNEYLPNYASQVETEADWYSTDNWFTTNFLFDKVIKNSGFAVGAMISGNIANGLIGAAGARIGVSLARSATALEAANGFKVFTPLLRGAARTFSAGKNIEAAEVLAARITGLSEG